MFSSTNVLTLVVCLRVRFWFWDEWAPAYSHQVTSFPSYSQVCAILPFPRGSFCEGVSFQKVLFLQ